MRILIVSNLYPPYIRGGNEVVIAAVVSRLHQSLHHLTVVTTRPYQGIASLRPEHFDEDGVTVYRFWPFNLYSLLFDHKYSVLARLFWHVFDIFNFHSYFVIKGIIQKQKPDVVITNNLTGIGFLLPLLLHQLRIRHLHIIHDVQLYTPSGLLIYGQENSWQERLVRWSGYAGLMRWLWGSPETVISPSKFLLQFYQQRNFFVKSKAVVIRNPIPFALTVRHQTVNGPLRLLFVGQITKAKGIIDLAKLILSHPEWNLSLIIAGLGPDIRLLAFLVTADKRIQLLGWRSRPEVVALLTQSDVLIHPSLCYENFPTSILEALAAGLPVLTSASGGAAELIHEAENGWSFQPGDWKELAGRLELLQQQPELARGLSENCQRSVADLTGEHYLQQLHQLL